jgi:hypothetical protein
MRHPAEREVQRRIRRPRRLFLGCLGRNCGLRRTGACGDDAGMIRPGTRPSSRRPTDGIDPRQRQPSPARLPKDAGAGRVILHSTGQPSSPADTGASRLGQASRLNIKYKQWLNTRPRPVEGRSWLDKGPEMLLDALGFEPASIDIGSIGRAHRPRSSASMPLILKPQLRIGPRPEGIWAPRRIRCRRNFRQ